MIECQKLAEEVVNFGSRWTQEAVLICQYYSNADDVESWAREKLQLISDMDGRNDKHYCSTLLKKVAQIEGRIKGKQNTGHALMEKISSIQQSDEDMFDKLNLAVAFLAPNTSKCGVTDINLVPPYQVNINRTSNLILSKQKYYERKLASTKLDMEMKVRRLEGWSRRE